MDTANTWKFGAEFQDDNSYINSIIETDAFWRYGDLGIVNPFLNAGLKVRDYSGVLSGVRLMDLHFGEKCGIKFNNSTVDGGNSLSLLSDKVFVRSGNFNITTPGNGFLWNDAPLNSVFNPNCYTKSSHSPLSLLSGLNLNKAFVGLLDSYSALVPLLNRAAASTLMVLLTQLTKHFATDGAVPGHTHAGFAAILMAASKTGSLKDLFKVVKSNILGEMKANAAPLFGSPGGSSFMSKDTIQHLKDIVPNIGNLLSRL